MSRLPTPVRWVLLMSLALNVALATALALPWLMPSHYERDGREHRHRSDRVPSPWALRRTLGEERAELIESTVGAHREAIRGAIRAVHAARRDVRAAMQAEPFDREALERAFEELRRRDAEVAAVVQAVLAEVMAELTPEERAQVAELMPERRRHRRGGRDGSREASRESSR